MGEWGRQQGWQAGRHGGGTHRRADPAAAVPTASSCRVGRTRWPLWWTQPPGAVFSVPMCPWAECNVLWEEGQAHTTPSSLSGPPGLQSALKGRVPAECRVGLWNGAWEQDGGRCHWQRGPWASHAGARSDSEAWSSLRAGGQQVSSPGAVEAVGPGICPQHAQGLRKAHFRPLAGKSTPFPGDAAPPASPSRSQVLRFVPLLSQPLRLDGSQEATAGGRARACGRRHWGEPGENVPCL